MRTRVFVYGTLRKDQVNHYLLEAAQLLGFHTTAPIYKMFDLGSYPGVTKGGHTAIQGEVYEVDTRVMAELDQLEGYPVDYTREYIPTPWGRAWIYLYRRSLRDWNVIPSGVWQDPLHLRRWSR
ncbi:MAG: gamma-glutamylcyclotransferase family protein [Candidatus Thiodiazotropha sp.]